MANGLNYHARDNKSRWREVMAQATGSRPHLLVTEYQRSVLRRVLAEAEEALRVGDVDGAINEFYLGICDIVESTTSGSQR